MLSKVLANNKFLIETKKELNIKSFQELIKNIRFCPIDREKFVFRAD